jgi:hypothetical protein
MMMMMMMMMMMNEDWYPGWEARWGPELVWKRKIPTSANN